MNDRPSESFRRATEFLNADRRGPADENARRILLGLYRLLAEGDPLTPRRVAARLGETAERVAAALAAVPESSVERDTEGRIVGFGGLTLTATRHRLRVGGRTLHTWCAFDTLFAPGLLGEAVEIASTCPVTGADIRLVAAPDGVREVTPSGARLSFVTPDAADCHTDIRGAFCCHVHFLESDAAAARWRAVHDDALILSLAEGFELGRIRNDTRFSEMLFS